MLGSALMQGAKRLNFPNGPALEPILWWLCGFRLYKFDNILQMQYMKYILNMCLIHLQSIKMKNRIRFKYCWGICLMQYVWNMLNIILEVIETFHTHSPRVLRVCTGGTRDGHPAWGWRDSGSTNFPGSTNPLHLHPHLCICISQLQWNQRNEIQIYPGRAGPKLQGMSAARFSAQPVKAAIKPFSNEYFCKYTRAGNIPG